WFCAGGNASASGSATTGAGGQLQPLPPAAPPAPPAPPPPPAPPVAAAGVEVGGAAATPVAPPVVVYQPAPPVVVVQGRADAPPPYYYRPRPAMRLPYNRSEWGLNLRLEGAILGGYRSHDNAGMGGGGIALRYKPSPYVGIEGGVDFVGGHDYYNNRRGETDFNLSALIYANPHSHVQLYFPIGVDWSVAKINTEDGDRWTGNGLPDTTYHYFGGHAGIGIEFRVARHFALNLTLLGFVRGRTDSNADSNPEFVDPNTGRKTNTSGGGLVQGGMTIYF
ncbi:MAG TPA: outer membrane beta-barrel protein, partial [Polyangiaceae bacterium]|nr:outer membrane beta-barrel protein [Polyangiaceae bacterium]